MACLAPRKVGFLADGKTISWSHRKYSREYPTFKLPCGKCIQCRLDYAREAAIRCYHESKMHKNNCFITLTYSDEHLKSSRLIYSDFQKFMKKLRDKIFREFNNVTFGSTYFDNLSSSDKRVHLTKYKKEYDSIKIGFFATGEYGDITKRPHWHALIFNWMPDDIKYKYSNDRGDKIYTSEILDNLWGYGFAEIGSVTMESAGYCARYAAKKLVHGKDGEHDYNPVHKRSNKKGIGRSFFDKYWQDMFNYGYVVLPNGSKAPIPRYYEKLLKKYKYNDWLRYMEKVKLPKALLAEEKFDKQEKEINSINEKRHFLKGWQRSQSSVKKQITEENFKRLQDARKGE